MAGDMVLPIALEQPSEEGCEDEGGPVLLDVSQAGPLPAYARRYTTRVIEPEVGWRQCSVHYRALGGGGECGCRAVDDLDEAQNGWDY